MISLEEQFKKVREEAFKEIEKYEDEALKQLNKAIEISEKYGMPYDFNITNLNNRYMPESFQEKWGELSKKFLIKYDYDLDYNSGWEHSDIC